MIKVAINGFGRIGRLAFRQIVTQTDFDIVAINDLTSAEDLAYLVKYDTVHGSFHEDEIRAEGNEIVVAGVKRIKVFSETDPANLPWGELGIDLVLECTGKFTAKEDAMKHISAGAKKVLISAPGKGEMKTVVYGVNDNVLTNEDVIVSAASCTTNCLAPVLNIIHKNIGIKKGFMTTVHAYTNDQATLDIAHKKGIKSRRGRACAQNIVPSSTGAAKAIGLVIPELLGKLDGNALRVPTADGSVVDLTLELSRNTSVEEINKLFQDNQNETIKFTMDPIVSSDCLGKKVGAIVDGLSTSIVEAEGSQLVKVLAWYDNEYGYTAQMLRTAKKMF
ncbi:glyceraldehyde-3-phosphate dehydrogenase [Firmicutes bacterium CAG:460]|mgnify:FL=1|nr:glyceraldehyde-3-phosphate dehydrogenase [Firmicutes bacterium CAG:460]